MKLLSLALTGAMALSVTGVSTADTPRTVRVSVSTLGGQAEPTPAQLEEPGVHRMHSDEISVNADGRFAVFTSNAVNLVPGDTNGTSDVFLRDLTAGVTTRIGGSGYSGQPSISADGRYVAFTSYADDLVPGDTNERPDVFVRDTVAGTTTRASVSATGAQDSGSSTDGVISANGRFVAYVTYRSELIDDNGPVSNVVVKDLATGTLTRASVPVQGGPLVDDGYGVRDLAISADGASVAFITKASNLVAGDTNNAYDVFIRKLNTTTRVEGPADKLALSADGQHVAYEGRKGVFVRDLAAGTTKLVDAEGRTPSISADGSRVAFMAAFTIVVRDLATNKTTVVSGDGDSMEPSISGDGSSVGFSSYATNLVPGDTNGHKDVFVRVL
ncbi:hypothetical protein [Lentzea sp. NPDC051838]|uniref:TolB family protein n=1 Tax=Lentzea sp. NPDC051838 TaxID=3154849 RepID=UPI003421CB1D